MAVQNVPPALTWWCRQPSAYDEKTLSVSFQLAIPEHSPAASHFVHQLQATYRSIEDDAAPDFFKRLQEVVMTQDDRVIHRLSSSVWSSSIVLQQQNLIKDRKESMLFLPLPSTGFSEEVNTHPITVTFRFRSYQREQERLGVFVLYQTGETAQVNDYYWTFTPPQYVAMPAMTDTTTDSISIDLTQLSPGTILGQLVFFISGVNAWIGSGELVSVASDGSVATLAEFCDPYHSVVVDKIIHGLPLPKVSMFTLTMCNWQKEKPKAGMYIQPETRLRLLLKLERLPMDSRPKEANLEIFAVQGVSA